MKLPQQFDLDFYKHLFLAGWDEDRKPLIRRLPAGLADLPKDVKTFVAALWWITLCKEYHVYANDELICKYEFFFFGEQEHRLIDLSDERNFHHYLLVESGLKIRMFGFNSCQDLICIDDIGRIYMILDRLYYCGGKYYEGLRNVCYDTGRLFVVARGGRLIEVERGTKRLRRTRLNLHEDFLE